jgi:hypothetical protein
VDVLKYKFKSHLILKAIQLGIRGLHIDTDNENWSSFSGYCYIMNRSKEDRIYWVCRDRRKKCKGLIFSSLQTSHDHYLESQNFLRISYDHWDVLKQMFSEVLLASYLYLAWITIGRFKIKIQPPDVPVQSIPWQSKTLIVFLIEIF